MRFDQVACIYMHTFLFISEYNHQNLIQYKNIMFKKNPSRPSITISLKKVPTGYKLFPKQNFNLFDIKRVARSMYRPDLIQATMGQTQGLAGSSTIIQPPSHLTLPAFAHWFDINSVHQIERQCFPQFFTNNQNDCFSFSKKNQRLYKYYRNAMVGMWRENIKKYLSSSQCRRNLAGDVSSIVRIHGFLQSWGLINFPSKEHSRGMTTSPPDGLSCHICGQKHASIYHIAQVQDTFFQICNTCYNHQLYPSSILPQEFVQVLSKNHKKHHYKIMSMQQIMRMLEILMGCGANRQREKEVWTSVQKQFPAFTREELVYNFLRIPLAYQMNGSIFENCQDQQQQSPLQQGQQPSIFQDYRNPVQIGIAISYFRYKTSQEQQPKLKQLFQAAERHAKVLSQQQTLKIQQLTKMMVEVQYSKLQLKTLFIEEYENLLVKSRESMRRLGASNLAQALKSNVRLAQGLEQPEDLALAGAKVE